MKNTGTDGDRHEPLRESTLIFELTVVTNDVPVTLFGVELDCEATDVSNGILREVSMNRMCGNG